MAKREYAHHEISLHILIQGHTFHFSRSVSEGHVIDIQESVNKTKQSRYEKKQLQELSRLNTEFT